MTALLLLIQASAPPERIGSPLYGIIIPGFILIVSFIVTWMMYKHFSKHS